MGVLNWNASTWKVYSSTDLEETINNLLSFYTASNCKISGVKVSYQFGFKLKLLSTFHPSVKLNFLLKAMFCQRTHAVKHPCKWNYWTRHWDDISHKWNLESHTPVRGSGLSYFGLRASCPGCFLVYNEAFLVSVWAACERHAQSLVSLCHEEDEKKKEKKNVPVEGAVMLLTWNSQSTLSSPRSPWQPVLHAQ